MSFVHLHTHSHYSLLESPSKVNEILDRAKELGMDTIAVTEYVNLYSAVEFTVMAKERGMKIIIGCEMFVSPIPISEISTHNVPTYNLTLLVTNTVGYKNLMQLITKAQLEGLIGDKPRIDKNTLKEYGDGIIALSGCLEGEIPQCIIKNDLIGAKKIALEYKALFGAENFYFELQSHPRVPEQERVNRELKKLGKELAIPLVATADVHYIHPEDSTIQDIMICIKDNRKEYENDRRTMADLDLFLKSETEMRESFSDVPEAVDNTQEIADRCNFKITLGEIQLPHYPLPEGHTPIMELRALTEKGIQKRFGGAITPEYQERLEYELSIIEKMDYPEYFLIVQDFINWARENQIVVGPGRGSAAGSFVSYLTGITNIDPIKYNLLFERFLNPERVSMPDVDMDFADDRRDEVLSYCRSKYGWDHVAHIITFGTMAARAAIRDVGRAMGLSYGFCDQIAKLVPMFSSIDDTFKNIPEFKNLYDTNTDAKRLLDYAKKLEGVCRHASVHACGVVITKNPVVEYTPVQRVSGDDAKNICTQYSSSTKTSYVEKIGLLKMDFLGLKNLTIIQNTLRIIRKIDNIHIDIETLPLDDKSTYALLERGETTGVFQLESSGMKRYLKLLKPTVFEDIVAMVALYRPGPMDWIPDFIAGKHGTKKIKYHHPKLEPILQNTYGVAVYQEQVMQIAQALAGFSLGEADILRKAMGKKILDLIKEQREKFIAGCEKTGVGRKIGEKIFQFIEPFAGYGFNRSHAACYALIGYQTAYLKAHYPAEFMAALLTSDQSNTDRIAIEVSECKDMGITVLPPNINESFEEFAVIQHTTNNQQPPKENKGENINPNSGFPASSTSGNLPTSSPTLSIHSSPPTSNSPIIRFGLNAIKNVGRPIAKAIVEERKRNGKFTSLANFIERVRSHDLNKRSLESLAKVGAFDGIAERNEVLVNMESILNFIKVLSSQKNIKQSSLFDGSAVAPPTIYLKKTPPASKKELLGWEKQLLGLYVSDHPTREYESYLDRVTHRLDRLDHSLLDKSIMIGGIIQTGKKIFLKDQKQMYFAMIENTRGKIECVVFPRVYEETHHSWENDSLVIVRGKLTEKDGQYKLLAESVQALSPEEIVTLKRIEATRKKYIKKESSASDEERVNDSRLKDSSPAFPTHHTSPDEINRADRSFILNIPQGTSKETLQKLSDALRALPAGDTPVILLINDKEIKTSFQIGRTKENEKKLKEILGG